MKGCVYMSVGVCTCVCATERQIGAKSQPLQFSFEFNHDKYGPICPHICYAYTHTHNFMDRSIVCGVCVRMEGMSQIFTHTNSRTHTHRDLHTHLCSSKYYNVIHAYVSDKKIYAQHRQADAMVAGQARILNDFLIPKNVLHPPSVKNAAELVKRKDDERSPNTSDFAERKLVHPLLPPSP